MRSLILASALFLANPALGHWSIDSGGYQIDPEAKIAERFPGADFSAQVEAAQDAAPIGGKILITKSHTITTAIDLDQPNTTITCVPGVVLTKGADVRMFDVTAANVTIENCEMDGNKAAAYGITVNVYVQHGADGLRLLDNRIRDSNGPNIEMTGVGGLLTGVTIRGNSITGANKTEIVIIRNVANILIDGNEIFHDSATRLDNTHGVIVHTQNVADTARNVVVTNNRMKIGGSGVSGGVCMEAGAFGGGDLYNLIFANNTCEAVGDHADMVSFANQSYVTIANNTYIANGNASGLPVIEMAASTGFTITGNLLYLDGVSSGLIVDASSDGTITGNLFHRFGSDSGEHFAVKFYNNGGDSKNVTVAGNTFVFPTPTSGINDFAIPFQSVAAHEISGIAISGNAFIGAGVGSGGAGTVGVRTEENSGTITDIVIGSNLFSDLNHAILVGSNVSNVSVGVNHYQSVLSRVTTNTGNTGVFVIDRGADPFPGSRCADGSLWVDTDTSSDTNCTTGANGALCRCVGGAWVTVTE